MLYIAIFWLVSAFASFGILGINYLYMRRAAKKPWTTVIDKSYSPRVSLIVPTFNECEVIKYKLRNLERLEYPKDLLQLIFVDSKSTDSTVKEIQEFAYEHPNLNIEILVENERKGKSSALNFALKSCLGDVVAISDADCFWPPEILSNSIPYLADPKVGAISGPKSLLNPFDSWVTKSENRYLKSMNLVKLGESKRSSTILFEGGFSIYKRKTLEDFDPYKTGSDDCGTVITLLEKDLRAIMVQEGEFFTTFPNTFDGKMEIKLRRASQLILLLSNYCKLLLKGRIKTAKSVVARNIVLYAVAPVMFLCLIFSTIFLFLQFPPLALGLLLLLFPKINGYVFEAVLNYGILLYSAVADIANKRSIVWGKPQDRMLVNESMLLRAGLI